jgi:hypothetical protein
MKNKLLIIAFILTAKLVSAQTTIYQSKPGTSEISFFSKTSLEDIAATNKQATSVLNTATNEIAFFVPVKGFKFEKDLMETHFNEKYLETDKYPNASLKGKINEKIDYTKDGVYPVTVTSVITMHGVSKNSTEKGIITIKNGEITIHSVFNVVLVDYKIEVPKLVIKNVSYSPYKK